MRYRSVGLASCLVWQAVAWNHASESQLQGALDESGYTLVAFVLPTQQQSKALEKEWTALQETANDPNIISFDCTAHAAKCHDLEISSFPDVRVYHRDGRMDVYSGARKRREILPYLHRTLRPPVLEIPSHPSLSTLDDTVVIAQIHPDDWELYDALYDVARGHHTQMSFVVSPPEEGAVGSRVVCYRNWEGEGEGNREILGGEEDGEGEGGRKGRLEGFVEGCVRRRVPELSRELWEEWKEAGRHVLHFITTDEEEKDRYRKEVKELVGRYKDKVEFVVTDPTADVEGLAVTSDGEVPGLLLEDTRTGELWRYSNEDGKEATSKSIEEFLERVLESKNIGEAKQETESHEEKAFKCGMVAKERNKGDGKAHEEL